MPEYWTVFAKAYRRGKKSIPIKDWQWFSILQEPTHILINKINTHAKN
jgi:hypothetical protein